MRQNRPFDPSHLLDGFGDTPAVVGTSRNGRRTLHTNGPASDGSTFRIASLTKPLVAVASVVAARRAGVALDAPILDLLPQLREDWAADPSLTTADVLSQTSGLSPTVTSDDVAALEQDDGVSLEAARLVVRAGNIRPPGEAWEYYNGNYFLAGAVLAVLSGTTVESATDELVLRPWGLRATSFAAPPTLVPGADNGAPLAAPGYPRGRRPSGGLCSTAPDLLTFGERLLQRDDLLREVRRERTRAGDTNRYGLGWAIGPSGQMYLNGRLPGYRAALLLVPAHGLVGVTLAADSEALPAAAKVLSTVQEQETGDDLAEAINDFAAPGP